MSVSFYANEKIKPMVTDFLFLAAIGHLSLLKMRQYGTVTTSFTIKILFCTMNLNVNNTEICT